MDRFISSCTFEWQSVRCHGALRFVGIVSGVAALNSMPALLPKAFKTSAARSRLSRGCVAGLLFALSGIFSSSAIAGDVPGFQKLVSLQAVEQTVPAFVESLFSQIGVPVRVESSIPGTVNGAFKGTAEEVFAQISQAFNVYLYYDTSAAYVYPSYEIQSVILPLTLAAAKRVATSAVQMGFTDQRNFVTPIEGGGLMVNGSVRFTEQIESLSTASREQVKSVKPKISPIEFRLFRLKYAWADDVDLNVGGRNVKVPGVATMLRTLVLDDGSLPLASGVSVRRDELRLAKLKGTGLQAEINGDDEEKVVAKASRQQGDSQFSIVAQPQLNAVAIRDRADRMPLYEQLIESLDVEPEMVEIEATIIDINVNRTRELGINWRLQDGDSDFLFGQGTPADQLLQPGQIITPQGQGGVLSLVLGDSTQFFSRVRALEREGAANVVSKPHVLTLSNVEAILGATQEFFVRVEGTEEVDLFKVPVGTVLRVTPHVYKQGPNSGIKLLVNIEDGAAIPNSSVDNIPVVERSAISTQALIAEGSSLLIGGMVRESNSESEVRVPLLGQVPWLGRLFKSTQTSSTKTERLFMITPRIANSDPSTFDRAVPTLQGDPIDIVSSTDRIDRAEARQVQQRADRLAVQIERRTEVSPEVEIKTDASSNAEKLTMQLLQIPEAPTEEEIIQSRALMQWHEVSGSEESKDVVIFEEVRTSLLYNEEEQLESKLVETTATFSDDLKEVVVPAGKAKSSTPKSSIPKSSIRRVDVGRNKADSTSVKRSAIVRQSPVNRKPALVTQPVPQRPVKQQPATDVLVAKKPSRKQPVAEPVILDTTKSRINKLAVEIAWDLKARRSESALEKISQLKKLSPDHDYSINGESYVAQLADYLEQSPQEL